jgi:hypothetical protein
MTERRPIQYAAGTLAASAFVAVTQILAGATLDVPLYVALTIFAANIPFQVMLFFVPLPFNIDDLPPESRAIPQVRKATQQQKVYASIWFLLACVSMPAVMIGFAAMFWHFACWLGILFAIAALMAFWLYRHWALKTFRQTPP